MSAKKAKGPNIVTKKATGGVAPKKLYALASPKSLGGVSMFEAQDRIHSGTVAHFASEPEVITRAVNRLRDAGFEILQISPLMINIAGSISTYERAFNTKIEA